MASQIYFYIFPEHLSLFTKHLQHSAKQTYLKINIGKKIELKHKQKNLYGITVNHLPLLEEFMSDNNFWYYIKFDKALFVDLAKKNCKDSLGNIYGNYINNLSRRDTNTLLTAWQKGIGDSDVLLNIVCEHSDIHVTNYLLDMVQLGLLDEGGQCINLLDVIRLLTYTHKLIEPVIRPLLRKFSAIFGEKFIDDLNYPYIADFLITEHPNMDTLTIFLDHGMEINPKMMFDSAIGSGASDVAEHFYKMDPTIELEFNYFISSIEQNEIEMVQFFLDTFDIDDDWMDISIKRSYECRPEMVQLLVDHGAELGPYRKKLIKKAKQHSNMELVSYLQRN